jgi:hypothetical protein
MLTNEREMEKNSVRHQEDAGTLRRIGNSACNRSIADDNRVRVPLEIHFLAGKQKGQQEQ